MASASLALAVATGATLVVAILTDQRVLRWAYILTAASFALVAVTSMRSADATPWVTPHVRPGH